MNEMKKSCNTCKYAYYKKDTSRHPTIGILRQHCANEAYNSLAFTEEMYLKDFKTDIAVSGSRMKKGKY